MLAYLNNLRTNDEGAAAVETALVLPFIAVFLFGVMQISLIFYDLSMTQNSLEEAARDILILSDPTDSDVRAAANAAIYQPKTASVVLTTSFVDQFGSDYAQLNAAFSYTVHIPFTKGLSIQKSLGTEIILQR